MTPLFEGFKAPSWWTLLKALLYDGGPSSTRFVFLAVFAVTAFGYAAVVVAFVVVYMRDQQHPASAGVLAVLTVTSGAMTAIAANSQNVRNQLSAKISSPTPIEAESTPTTGSVKEG